MSFSSILFYKTKFSIKSADEKTSDLLWCMVLHIRWWQTGKWNRGTNRPLPEALSAWTGFKMGGELISDDNRVYLVSSYTVRETEKETDWACRIVETFTKEGFLPRQWVTDVGFRQQADGTAQFSCLVSYRDQAGYIGEPQPRPGGSVPGLIRRIVEDPCLCCTVGSDIPIGMPQELHPQETRLWLERVYDENRVLPYILISPLGRNGQAAGEEQRRFLLDPTQTADMLLGNALVFYAADDTPLDVINRKAPDFACYDGAFHVYYPGCRHRWMGAEEIESLGRKTVMLFLRRAFVESMERYDRFFVLEDCRRLSYDQRHQQTLNDMQKRHQTAIQAMKKERMALSEYVAMLEEELDRLNKDIDDSVEIEKLLESENEKLRSDNRMLSTEKENLEVRLQIAEETVNGQYEGRRTAETPPTDAQSAVPATMPPELENSVTVTDVLTYFRIAFADRLIIDGRAFRSAKDCKLPPAEVWKILYALGTRMVDLFRQEANSGDIYRQLKLDTGLDVSRGEGNKTHKNHKIMKQYSLTLGGEKVNIEPHIRPSDNNQRVHFGYSAAERKVVIGHCGEHLDNGSTIGLN